MARCATMRRTLVVSTRSRVRMPDQAVPRQMSPGAAFSTIASMVDAIVPRYRFGTSLYTTPVLLFLRLFYSASSFNIENSRSDLEPSYRAAKKMESTMMTRLTKRTGNGDPAITCKVICQLRKIEALEWCSHAQGQLALSSCRLISVTWVKGLASNLTHEYIQFVYVDADGSTRYRGVVDRNDDGDHVFIGHDWTSSTEPTASHKLPLPLLSISFDHLPTSSRPLLSEFAAVVASVSASQPGYDPYRYMCWWFAETILSTIIARHGGELLEWKSANLRYTVVVRTSIFRRKTLTKRAEAFRILNASSMVY